MTSAMWASAIWSQPSRSATVRASLSSLSRARADSPRVSKAPLSSRSAPGVRGQTASTAAGESRALQRAPVRSARSSCRCLPAATRARTAAEDSPRSREERSLYSTGSTARCRSMRSRMGPLTRPR